MRAWQIELERTLSAPDAPAALDSGLIERFVLRVAGKRLAASTLARWQRDAVERGRLRRVLRGVYLNGFRSRAGRPADAAPLLRRDAVVSLNTVLGDAGVLNNPSATVTAILPLDPGPVKPVTGRINTGVGWFHFFAMPRRVLEAGRAEDRVDSDFHDHVRATPERALVDWLYLAESRLSRRTPPNPGDLDLALLDKRRLQRLAAAVGVSLDSVWEVERLR